MTPLYRGLLGAAVGCPWLCVMLCAGVAQAQPGEPGDEPSAEAPGTKPAPEGADEDPMAPVDEAPAGEEPKDEAEEQAPAEGEAAEAEASAKASTGASAKASVEVTGPSEEPAEPDLAADDGQVASFESLPPSAFATARVRGIPGGSMELDMQGAQSPYLPKVPGKPRTRIGFSGSVWVDTSHQIVEADEQTTDADLKQWLQQSRLVLRFTPTHNFDHGLFVQAQGEAVLNSDQTQSQSSSARIVDADDVWLKFGKWKLADLQLGRFQGWEVYHYGMGLDYATFERTGATTDNNVAVQIYGLTHMWDRPAGESGNGAINIYPVDFARLQLLGRIGNTGGSNSMGFRPVAIIDLGFVKAKGGAEIQRLKTREVGEPFEEKRKGVGGSIQGVFDPWVEAGVGIASTQIDVTDRTGGFDSTGSGTTTTYGGFINGGYPDIVTVGLGYHHTRNVNMQEVPGTGHGEIREHDQMFFAVQHLLMKKLYIKFVGAQGKARFRLSSGADYENSAISGRLRFMYLF